MEKSIHGDEYGVVTALIRELRLNAGITQVQMAEALGQTQSLYSKYERGEVRLDLIQLRKLLPLIGSDLISFVTLLEDRVDAPSAPTPRRRARSK